jgi:hypothetical protein
MSYTNSTACRLLATTCCVCNRPLVDAVSVQAGIGPDCRKKYMGKLEGAARDEANQIVHALALIVSGFKPTTVTGLSTEAVQTAYALGGAGAVGAMLAATHEQGASLLDRLRVLGFDKLADKFEKVWLPVRITQVGQEICLEAPYDDGAVTAQRSIKGRRWDKQVKANFFPVSQKPAVWAMLTRYYAGVAGIGPKGPFVVPATPPAAVMMATPKLYADMTPAQQAAIDAQEDAREARKAAQEAA